MSEVTAGVNAMVVGAVLARLQSLRDSGGGAAQTSASGVADLLEKMKRGGYDPITINYLTRELTIATHPQVNLVGMINRAQEIYDHL